MVLQRLMRCKGKMTFISSRGCHYILSSVAFRQNSTFIDPLLDPSASTIVQVRAYVDNSVHLLWIYMHLFYVPGRATNEGRSKKAVCRLFLLAGSSAGVHTESFE